MHRIFVESAKQTRSRIGGKCAANVDVILINDDGIDRVCNRVMVFVLCMRSIFSMLLLLVVLLLLPCDGVLFLVWLLFFRTTKHANA